MSTPIGNRYEFVYIFDVTNGNPNGDPDAGNLPRLDPETNKGLVTDVSLKRKIRNFVTLDREDKEGYAIYMQERAVLNNQHRKAWDALGINPASKDEYKKLPKDEAKARELTAWMCKNFFDIRAFGAVMTTGVNAGQVRGPVQLAFATSIEPVMPLEVSITRMAVTTEEDLGLLWRALTNMFEHDRSAARGEMAARKLIVFKHDTAMGNAPAHVLFDSVTVTRKDGSHERTPARSFDDYDVKIGNVPARVTVEEKL